MRILCDQMVTKSFVSALEAEDRHTVARVRDLLAPDADDNTNAAYAVQHDWVILTADDDYLSDDVLHGLLFDEDDPAPTSGIVRDVIREIDRV
jgi:predicted nuclease of predicted toxin-antitoxin system